MIKFDTSRLDPLKPYATAIKWGLAVVLALILLGSGSFIGCSYKENRMEKQIDKLEESRDYYQGQANVNAEALREVNTQYEANVLAAKQARSRAEAADKAAAKLRRDNAQEQESWERKYAKLRKTPSCATLLEMELCPALKDY